MKPWSGVIGEDGIEIQSVAAVEIGTMRGRSNYPRPNLHVYEFDWAPDSHEIAFVGANPAWREQLVGCKTSISTTFLS